MIAAASLVAATVTVSFLCAAAFVVALERYGLVDACLAGAGVFLVATMALLGTYAIYVARRRMRRRAQLWSRRHFRRSLICGSFWAGFRLSRRSASSGSSQSWRSAALRSPSLAGRRRREDAAAGTCAAREPTGTGDP